METLLAVLRSRRVLLMLVLGFASGLPLSLTGGALQAWLTVEGVDVRTIGVFSLVGLPYTLKFLWSPAMDRWVPRALGRSLLGRRRGWMLVTQLALVGGIFSMGLLPPATHVGALAVVALGVAFLSASQDIAFDAYRTDVLHEDERGLGVALSVAGYRLGMLVSGGLALVLADALGWPATFRLMAAFMAVGLLGTLLAPSPEHPAAAPPSLLQAVVGPFHAFLRRDRALWFLALVILYRLGDSYASSLANTFLLRGVGFSQTEVGVINKGVGVAAVLVGAGLGGALMTRLGLVRSLLVFGVLQAVTNFAYMLLLATGPSDAVLAVVVAQENLAGGMGTTALVALLMALCDARYTATQFALLSALTAIGRYVAGPTSGYLQAGLGWSGFYLTSALAALPGLALIGWLRRPLAALDAPTGEPGATAVYKRGRRSSRRS